MEKKSSGKMRYAIILIVVAVVLAAGLFVKMKFFGGSSQDSSSIITVGRGTIENLVTATGTLQPRDYVDVGAQVSGQLTKIHVEIGQYVKKGQLLAEIDPTLFKADVDVRRAQVRYQKAQLQDIDAKLALAETQVKRQHSLFKDSATTEEQVQDADTNLVSVRAQKEMLKAQIEQTEYSLRSDEAKLNYAMIYAPMDGTVVSITARQGQTLNANQQAPTILQIADLTTMRVQTEVSEADVSKLKTGMSAYFTTLGSKARRWSGVLQRLEPTPTVENNVVLYNAVFDVNNANSELLPQMTAQVSFVSASVEDVLVIPAGAIKNTMSERKKGAEGGERRRRNGGEAGSGAGTQPRQEQTRGEVTVLTESGTTEIRFIKTGLTNRIMTEVLSGLEEGEKLVLHRDISSENGQKAQNGNTQNRALGNGMPSGMPRMR